MNAQIGTLVSIFLIQCAMVGTLYWPEPVVVGNDSQSPLISFDPDRIDEIYIADAQGNKAVLLKMSDRWLLPDLAGMPIDPTMLTTLLTSLGDRSEQWPIATTDSSRQRFKVAAYLYQRRLTLLAEGELLATLYLGTSPGFRTVHARNDADSSIYRILFNTYEAPALASEWLDQRLLQVVEPITIRSGEYLLSKKTGEWTSSAAGLDRRRPDARELATLLSALSALEVEGIAGQDMQRTLSIATAQIKLEIDTADRSTELLIFTVGEKHFIRSDKYDYYFALSQLDFDRLASIHALTLMEAL